MDENISKNEQETKESFKELHQLHDTIYLRFKENDELVKKVAEEKLKTLEAKLRNMIHCYIYYYLDEYLYPFNDTPGTPFRMSSFQCNTESILENYNFLDRTKKDFEDFGPF